MLFLLRSRVETDCAACDTVTAFWVVMENKGATNNALVTIKIKITASLGNDGTAFVVGFGGNEIAGGHVGTGGVIVASEGITA